MFRSAAAFLCGAMLLASVAHADWPNDPAVNLPVCTASGDQIAPLAVPDGGGGFIVVWQDKRSDAFGDLYAQRVSAAGTVMWNGTGVPVCTLSGQEQTPVVAADGAGGVLVAWVDGRDGPSQVYLQRLDASGVAQFDPNGIAVTFSPYGVATPAVESDGVGGAFVVWSDFRNLTDYDLYAQRVGSDGLGQWDPSGVVVSFVPGTQNSPVILSDGLGGILIAWQDSRAGLTDVYAARLDDNGSQWWGNVAVCTAAGNQSDPVIVSDGQHGAILGWRDQRAGNDDLYARRVRTDGVPQWTANGVVLCNAANAQTAMTLASDGAGGAIFAWQDSRSGTLDVYAQRLASTGSAQWTANGIVLGGAIGNQQSPAITSDGIGGAIVMWTDSRGSDADIYSQRVSASGTALWTPNGTACSLALSQQQSPSMVPTGSGGAIGVWQDRRNGLDFDLYAQSVDDAGHLGNPAPSIFSVRDVPADQGGKVRIRWRASYLDVFPTLEISLYGLWREVPESAALARAPSPSLASASSEIAGTIRAFTTNGVTSYWEGLGTVAARGDSVYSFVAITLEDSSATGSGVARYRVDAHAAFFPMFWDSSPDSGYSVDNLAPSMPAAFLGVSGSGTTALHWARNAEYDFSVYRLHRGSSPSFTPGPGNLVTQSPDTGYVDPLADGSTYKLAAVDVHGNGSAYAVFVPQNATNVGPQRFALRFAPPAPNPSMGRTAFEFTLPATTRVTLAIYDAAGREVSRVIDRELAAGDHRFQWAGADRGGRGVASGFYVARLITKDATLERSFALLK